MNKEDLDLNLIRELIEQQDAEKLKEVLSGMDCGLNIQGYNDIKVGDVVEAYTIEEIKRKL